MSRQESWHGKQDYRVDIVLRERLLSGRCVAIEGEHAYIDAGLIRCTDAHALLQHTCFHMFSTLPGMLMSLQHCMHYKAVQFCTEMQMGMIGRLQ